MLEKCHFSGLSITLPKSMILSLARDIAIFIPSLLVLAKFYGVVGMLWAALIADILSFILLIVNRIFYHFLLQFSDIFFFPYGYKF